MKNLPLLLCLLAMSLWHFDAFSESLGEESESLTTQGLEINDSILRPYEPDPNPGLTLRVDPDNPGIPEVQTNYAVGSVGGSLVVSQTGAAEYHIPFDCPDGGNLTPSVGLAYSSQNSDYGLAGYGFTISGISVITHGEKTIFNNDGVVSGVKYDSSDNLYLDGKRMILLSGSPCQEGATYCLEGSPHTKITAHGSYADASATTWFEVQTPDGLTYQYGRYDDSRVSFRNTSGKARIASWYVSRIEDVYSNYTTYTYSIQNNYAYPANILYGSNSEYNRGLNGRIEFQYAGYDDIPNVFRIEDQTGFVDRYLTGVITSLNGNVFRKYTFSYNHSSDLTKRKYSRLAQVTEENGAGEKLPPTIFSWSFLPEGTPSASTLKIATTDALNNIVKEEDRIFYAADLNGDGVSDIIRVSPVKINTALTTNQTRVYISRSNVLASGKIEYLSPLVYELPPSSKVFDSQYIIGGSQLLDFDGDGFNDILFPYHDYDAGINNRVSIKIIPGSSVVAGNVSQINSFHIKLKNSEELPLFATIDIDKDGRDEIIYVEKTAGTSGYTGGIVHRKDDATLEMQEFVLWLNKAPDKMFCGDYNNDGLVDIILLHEDGYKIYFNNGGSESSAKFSDSNSKTGTTLADQWRVQQGDFDGDGLLDFVYYKTGNSCLWIARNNGDGTFSTVQTDNVGVAENSTDKDNDKFTLLVYDFDGDGRSDVYVCKSLYSGKTYSATNSKWLYSNGTTLIPHSGVLKKRVDDAKEGTIFLGDFNGDGQIELANYGSRLNSSQDDSFEEGRLNIYSNSSLSAQSGRVASITDGLGNTTAINYSYLTDPNVYTRTKPSSNTYPLNHYTLPVAVVKNVSFTNGVAGTQTETYKYKDLKMHMRGAGLLGFSEIMKTNPVTTETTISRVTAWDPSRFIPVASMVEKYLGGKMSTEVSRMAVANVGGTYFAYESEHRVVDIYGNVAKTISTYDTAKGVVLEQTVQNDGNKMYKKVEYSGYENKGGVWRPTVVKHTQKHADDSTPFTNEVHYRYDDLGNTVAVTENYGTPMALSTRMDYDRYGNCTSVVSLGKDVKSVSQLNVYDSTGRFVLKSYTSPASSVVSYTYDIWGNVLTENDITDSANTLTTNNLYDGWGRLTCSLSPLGVKTVYKYGWGDSADKKYYNFVRPQGQPWVLTWYDAAGHETSTTTFGEKDVMIRKTTSYNRLGQVSEITTNNGRFLGKETLAYDALGRVVSDVLSSGKETSYAYGNRTVSTTSDGRTSTQTTDAWGNLLKATDATGGEVAYQYSSNGQPVKVTSYGSSITMKYDAAGNRIELDDPDAGKTTFEYSADGNLMKQTDARGVATVTTYDQLGRVANVKIGKYTITNTYGTSGRDALRLKKRSMGDKSIEYTYDKYGRVTVQKRNFSDSESKEFSYRYDNLSRLARASYPGGLNVDYTYSYYGFTEEVSAAGHTIYKASEHDGLISKSFFCNDVNFTRTCDANGFETKRELKALLTNIKQPIDPGINTVNTLGSNDNLLTEGLTVDQLDMKFDPITGNLLERKRYQKDAEVFGYDDLDRLVSVRTKTLKGQFVIYNKVSEIDYVGNGNIDYKTGIGSYTYNALKPHAVAGVDNEDAIIPSQRLLTSFNDLNRVSAIEQEGSGLTMEFEYGPDIQRWRSVIKAAGRDSVATLYAGNYERITAGGRTREFYYLDGSTIVVKENGKFSPYFAFTDHLGSILSVVDSVGTKVYEAYYDPWGVQRVVLNEIGLRRGYTGHEMLNEFGIINMNGRLYDPVLGRFFSPDPFVQCPDMAESFNRYSYCFNNPLKYNDPTGQISAGIIAFAVFNMATSMIQAAGNGENVWKAGALSLLSSAATYGIGQLFGGAGSLGHELLRAGAHGVAGGVFGMLRGGSFAGGFASGAVSSGLGSYAMSANARADVMVMLSAAGGGVAAWAAGSDFLQGALSGLCVAVLNHTYHYGELYTNDAGEYRYDFEKSVDCIGEGQPREHRYGIVGPESIGGVSNGGGRGNGTISILGLATAEMSIMGYKHALIDVCAKVAEKKGVNVTLGSNNKIYFPKRESGHPFYGNQYVTTQKLSVIGKKVVKYTKPVGYIVNAAYIGINACKDYYEHGKIGRNTIRATAECIGGYYGAEYGMKLGMYFGTYIGGLFGVVGSVPGAIIGGVVGGIIGYCVGARIGANAVEAFY